MSDRDRCKDCVHIKYTAGFSKLAYCSCPVPDWVDNPTQIVEENKLRTCPCYATAQIKLTHSEGN